MVLVKDLLRRVPGLLLLLAGAAAAPAQSLYEMPEGVETRWASGEDSNFRHGGSA